VRYTCDDCGYHWQQNRDVICIQCGGTNLLGKDVEDEQSPEVPETFDAVTEPRLESGEVVVEERMDSESDSSQSSS